MLPWILFLLTLAAAAGALVWTRRQHDDELAQTRSAHKATVSQLTSASEEASKRADRLQRAGDKALEQAHLGLVRDLLPTLDALEDARAMARDGAASSDQLADGLDMVLSSAHKALSAHDVTRVSPDPGAAFDPEIHEAVELAQTADVPDGSVAKSYRSGWRHPSRVIRPAMVTVARAPQEEVAFDFDHSSDDASSESVEEVVEEVVVSRES